MDVSSYLLYVWYTDRFDNFNEAKTVRQTCKRYIIKLTRLCIIIIIVFRCSRTIYIRKRTIYASDRKCLISHCSFASCPARPRVSVQLHIPVMTVNGDGDDDGDNCTGVGIVCVMHNRNRIVIKCVNIVHTVPPRQSTATEFELNYNIICVHIRIRYRVTRSTLSGVHGGMFPRNARIESPKNNYQFSD